MKKVALDESCEFITYQKAAQILGLSVVTIKKWAASGLIKRYAVTHRSVFVDKNEILTMIRTKGEL